jgi:outer membrane PBP1 activator LpoA protein
LHIYSENMTMKNTDISSRAMVTLPRSVMVLAVAAVMAGCTVAPKALTAEEVQDRVKNDTARMYTEQEAA